MVDLRPLPKTVTGLLGPIQISLVENVDQLEEKKEGTRFMGTWFPLERRIRIYRAMPLVTQWQTLFHEQVHAWLDETGARHGLDEDTEERICDSLSLGMVRQLQERGR